jgi:hypothetical protein
MNQKQLNEDNKFEIYISRNYTKQFLGVVAIPSNAFSILLALVGYVSVPSATRLVVAGLVRNQ